MSNWCRKQRVTDICFAECSIPTNDPPMAYLFHNKFPDTVDDLILQRCGFKEWTILKRVSQIHYRKITKFIDARFLRLLKRYVNEGIPLLRMLDDTRSIIAGQFLFKFLNLFTLNRTTDPPLLIFAPNGTQNTWLLFAQHHQMHGSVTDVPLVFEDFCSSYVVMKGLRVCAGFLYTNHH